MKAIGYSRVSTREQATEGLSLKNQAEKIRQYCKLKDLELVEIIEDAGESAKSLDRPGMRQLLDGCEKGKFDTIVIYKLDRLTRKVFDLGYLIEQVFDKNGIEFVSIQDSFDTSTANGKLFMNILITLAQWERDIISERTKDVLQNKKANGERLGPPLYGERINSETGEIAENPEEKQAVELAIGLRGEGWTQARIAKELNRKGFRTRRGKPWKQSHISYLLKAAA